MGNLRLHRIRKEIRRRNHEQQQPLRGEKEKESEIVNRETHQPEWYPRDKWTLHGRML